MDFAENLTALRKAAGLSQERLAERLGVSRQAVTKWERGMGEPELANVRAIATLFGVSFDVLLGADGAAGTSVAPPAAESVTEYDINTPKHFDIHLGGAQSVTVRADGDEKIRVRLSSQSLPSLRRDFKIRLDDTRGRLDVDVLRQHGTTEAQAKSVLCVDIMLPQQFLAKLEVAVNASAILLRDIDCPSVELDGRIAALRLDGVHGTVEVNSNLDMDIALADFSGSFELNQLFATSRLSVPGGFAFRERRRGIATTETYQRGGAPCPPFSTPAAENIIELNGMKSELVIVCDC